MAYIGLIPSIISSLVALHELYMLFAFVHTVSDGCLVDSETPEDLALWYRFTGLWKLSPRMCWSIRPTCSWEMGSFTAASRLRDRSAQSLESHASWSTMVSAAAMPGDWWIKMSNIWYAVLFFAFWTLNEITTATSKRGSYKLCYIYICIHTYVYIYICIYIIGVFPIGLC